MKAVLSALVVTGLMAIASTVASATGTQVWTSALTVGSIEMVGSGGIVVYLTGFSDPACSNNPTGIYIYPNELGVTQSGADQMLAAALTARTTGLTITIEYDDTGDISAGLCYGRYLEIQ